MAAWSGSLTNHFWLHTSYSQAYVSRLSTRGLLSSPVHRLPFEVSMKAQALAQHSKHSSSAMSWKSLGAPRAELTLDFTLPTGQSFRWRRTAPNEFTGVVESRVVKVRQLLDDVEYQVVARGANAHAADDAEILRDYFNLKACLRVLSKDWSERDQRYKSLRQYFPGARVLRQDPVECLFEFVCSSNNHISRIHGMVERLCRAYGTPLLCQATPTSPALPSTSVAPVAQRLSDGSFKASLREVSVQKLEAAQDGVNQMVALQSSEAGRASQEEQAVPDLACYSFPTLQQLSQATEAALRAEGFGYRAKFITGSVAMLLAKPGGGHSWLLNLRNVPYREASEALCELPGIGPKVAACICLFALDKHEAIPVDTHVWQLALRYYTPHLKGKAVNRKIMQAVEDAFIARFGPWAGWAHNTLFISELASQQENLPEHLRSKGAAKSKTSKKAAKKPEKTEVLGQKSVEDEGAVARTVVTVSRKRQGVKKERGEMQDMQDSDMEPVRNKRKTSGKGVSNVQAEDDLSTEIKTELSVETAMQDDQEALGFVTSRTGAKGEFNKGQSKQQQRVSKRLQMQTKSSSAAAVAAVDHVLNETASALGKESA